MQQIYVYAKSYCGVFFFKINHVDTKSRKINTSVSSKELASLQVTDQKHPKPHLVLAHVR